MLWIVIVAGVLLWAWPDAGNFSLALKVIFRGGLLVWAADEIVRGVNPWRRFLGAIVVIYEVFTIAS